MAKTNIIELNCGTDINLVEESLAALESGSALTMEGLDPESIPTMAEWFEEEGFMAADELKVYQIEGQLMNRQYYLTGNNAYQNTVTIVSMPLDQFDKKVFSDVKTILSMKQMGFRWFDDIVDNNAYREN